MKIGIDEKNHIGYKRESWVELFRIKVCPEDWDAIPKGFVRVKKSWREFSEIYYLWILVPFVKLFYLLSDLGYNLWWAIPTWLYKKGYFEHKMGRVEHWFWFRNVRFKKIVEREENYNEVRIN